MFTEAHQELRETDAIVDELGFHSTNAIMTKIVDQLRDEMQVPKDSPPPQPLNPSAPNNLPTVMPGVANVIQQANPAIMTLMQTMMESMEAMRLTIECNENNMFNEHGRGHDKDDKYAYNGYGRCR